MSVRASVVLPAPRSPERVTRSPGSTVLAMSIASRRVACSSGSATEKLDVSDLVSAMASLAARSREHCHRGSRSALLRWLGQREYASDRGAPPDRRLERHRAAVQLHERAHQGKPQARPAVVRAERMRLEPSEHLV